MNENSLIEKIKNGDMAILANIYSENRVEFILWVKKSFQCDDESAVDIYQASMLSLYENIISGKLVDLSSSLKTYLFAIGKNKTRELQRLNSKELKFRELYNTPDELTDEEDINPYEEKLSSLAHALSTLGNPCKKLLDLFYFHKHGLEEISKKMGYKNAETTKNLKYKCIVRLRKIYRAYE